jgi:amidase
LLGYPRRGSRPARTFDLTTASFADITAAFEAGALTSARLTDLYLARMDAFGPLAAHVADLATVLSAMVGADPRDADVTTRTPVDYRTAMLGSTLRGVRLGLIREYLNVDAAGDAVIEDAVVALRAEGAEVVDVTVGYLPRLLLGSYEIIRDTKFRFEIDAYLASLPRPDLPKRHAPEPGT